MSQPIDQFGSVLRSRTIMGLNFAGWTSVGLGSVSRVLGDRKTMLVDELRDLNFLLVLDWSWPEPQLDEQIATTLRPLANHPLRQQITVLIDSRGLKDSESASLLLFQTLMQLSLEELDVEALNIGLTGSVEPEEWAVVRSLLLAQLNNQASTREDLPRLDLVNFTQPEVYQALQLEAWQRWAEVFVTYGPAENAIAYYQKILDAQPTQRQSYLALSNVYEQLGQAVMAVQVLQLGISHCPDAPELYYWLIIRCNQQDDSTMAQAIAEQAAIQFPQDYTFELLHRLLLPQRYASPEAIATSRQAFTQGLETLLANFGQPTQAEAIARLEGFSRVTNFFLAYQGCNDRELQRQYGQLLHQTLAIAYPDWVKPRPEPISKIPISKIPASKLQTPSGKIRVGYLSAFLCSWSGTILFLNWLKYADKTQFELYAYQIGETIDAVSQEFSKHSDYFRHLPVQREAIATQVLQDQLHILVYPELGMDAPTFCLAGLRLAPIQCMAWGQPVTSGLPTMDYFLSNQAMEPEDQDSDQGRAHYTETLVKLPGVGISYPTILVPAPQRDRTAFGLRANAVVYLSSQAPYKYLPQYDGLYAAIAQQVPTAQFVFLRQGIPLPRLEHAFGQLGLNYQDYCIFLPVLPRDAYFDLLACCDVYLDTPSWAGGNTTLDAIAATLPIVTWPGELMRGRHSLGFLAVMGLTETVATAGDAVGQSYVAIAVKLAQHPEWRAELRQQLRAQQSILFDQPEPTRALEAFFKQALLALRASAASPANSP